MASSSSDRPPQPQAAQAGDVAPNPHHEDAYAGMSGADEYELQPTPPSHSPIPHDTSYTSLALPSLPTDDAYRPRPRPSSDLPSDPFGMATPTGDLTPPERLPRQGSLAERQFDSDRNLMSYDGTDTPAAEKTFPGPGAAKSRKRKLLLWGVPIALLLAAGLGVGLGVGLTRNKGSNSSGNASAGAGQDGSSTGGGATSDVPKADPSTPVTNTTDPVKGGSGETGSEVTTDLNVTFTYVNDFGGRWAYDPEHPFNVSGQAQSWTPPLTEEWVWGKDIARGVNLGGWLVTEPFICPALYEEYLTASPKPVDEFTLSQAMGADLAAKMEEHYRTFITEKDFADIAAAGLNWVRIPLGYWAIETRDDEPFLPKVSWTYFTKAIAWARKYGIRILLDFHALPGSQNGWNHSGKSGDINWMHGAMGLVNGQRTLEYIRSMVEYISQPGIREVVPMIGLVNEVQMAIVGKEAMGSFYYQAQEMIRGMTGAGAGKGPIVVVHEGFVGPKQWEGFLSGADRLGLDQHPYLAFTGANQNSWATYTSQACSWGGGTNDTQRDFGIIIGGEWSLATNDCGMWLNGVDNKGAYENTYGSCLQYEDWRTWDAAFKADVMNHAMGSMDALQNWFFWTWRIGNSTTRGYAPSPMWHYQLGLEQGWIPKDPRSAGGYCKRNGLCPGCYEFDGTFPASATGGVATQTIAAAEVGKYGAWPPAMSPAFVQTNLGLLPTLTQTGTPITLPVPAESAKWLTGWAYPEDKVGAYVPVAGCPYPNAYNALQPGDMPSALCGADGVGAPGPVTTPAAPAPTTAPVATTENLVVPPPPGPTTTATTSTTVPAPPAASVVDGAQVTAPPGVAA